MSRQEIIQDDLWSLKTAIARAVANSAAPTLRALQLEIVEEFGMPPEPALVEYFLDIVDPDREKYPKVGQDLEKQLAEAVARSPQATILKFRQAFLKKFQRDPADDLIAYFLEHLRRSQEDATRAAPALSPREFAKQMARMPQTTVLQFRQAYMKKFGQEPEEEITHQFLIHLQERRNLNQPPVQNTEEDLQSKMQFARTLANGLVPTVLQFRKAFAKAYREEPEDKIIEEFIRHLPKNE